MSLIFNFRSIKTSGNFEEVIEKKLVDERELDNIFGAVISLLQLAGISYDDIALYFNNLSRVILSAQSAIKAGNEDDKCNVSGIVEDSDKFLNFSNYIIESDLEDADDRDFLRMVYTAYKEKYGEFLVSPDPDDGPKDS